MPECTEKKTTLLLNISEWWHGIIQHIVKDISTNQVYLVVTITQYFDKYFAIWCDSVKLIIYLDFYKIKPNYFFLGQ